MDCVHGDIEDLMFLYIRSGNTDLRTAVVNEMHGKNKKTLYLQLYTAALRSAHGAYPVSPVVLRERILHCVRQIYPAQADYYTNTIIFMCAREREF